MVSPNISSASRTRTMGFAQVAPLAPILAFANTVREITPGNLVPDQRITSSNIINIMHPPDNHLSIENLRISTSIKAKPLANFLKGYYENIAPFLTTSFTYGFKIPYQGPWFFRLSKNLSSINGKEIILHQRISTPIKAHCGVFRIPSISKHRSVPPPLG